MEALRIVVVGGVAGGASAAARARRLSEDAQIVLLERGRDISFANCGLPYHIGGTIPQRDRLLVTTAKALGRRYRIDVRARHEVLRIDRQGRQLVVRDLAAGREYTQPYDKLILSPGAYPVRPPIPGVDLSGVLTLRNLQDMDAINQAIESRRARRAVVIGGGYIGLEMAEALRSRGLAVSLVELAQQVFIAADPEMVAPIHQQLSQHGVDLQLGASVSAVRRQGEGLSVTLSTGRSIACDLAILAVGVRPEVALAREAGLEIGSLGGIVVDDHMRTSDPDIFAVGDAVEVVHLVSGQRALIPLAGPANRQGRIAADNALGRDSAYHATQGTAICKVFDLAIGMTGLSEKALKAAGARYEKVYVHPAHHAGYYPGATQMSLKLLFDPDSGKVLGGQAVGPEGVDKRIDVLAVAIRAGLTVEDLAEQELAYAPPFGSAKDPINYAGFVASNARNGDVRLCHVDDVLNPRSDQVLLDVRSAAEVEAGTIPGSRNIPIDQLRDRLGELPAGKEVLAFCQVGLRGYLACRILSQRGIACRNLCGGYKTYQAAVGMPGEQAPPAEDQIAEDTGESAQAVVAAAAPAKPLIARTVDATALQCPGPIMKLKDELERVQVGQAVRIVTADPGFVSDAQAWCHATGHQLLEAGKQNGTYAATVVRTSPAGRGQACGDAPPDGCTIVVFSGDFDKAMAAFIIANGAAATGSKVTLFFTFWGLNILRRDGKVPTRKTLVERTFGWMMPRGAGRLTLSRMNMGGMGTAMIKGVMARKNVPSLVELIASARAAGVRLVACRMSMDLMGLRREELIDGVEEGGVATYLDHAGQSRVNLFI